MAAEQSGKSLHTFGCKIPENARAIDQRGVHDYKQRFDDGVEGAPVMASGREKRGIAENQLTSNRI